MDEETQNGGMRPRDSTETEADSRGDAEQLLQYATEEPRSNLLADIVGHPKGAPSLAELAYTNPSFDEVTIHGHLAALRDAGVVRVLKADAGDRDDDLPEEFYTLTDDARELFEERGLFPEQAWTRQYERVEKSPRIRDLEAVPRPE